MPSNRVRDEFPHADPVPAWEHELAYMQVRDVHEAAAAAGSAVDGVFKRGGIWRMATVVAGHVYPDHDLAEPGSKTGHISVESWHTSKYKGWSLRVVHEGKAVGNYFTPDYLDMPELVGLTGETARSDALVQYVLSRAVFSLEAARERLRELRSMSLRPSIGKIAVTEGVTGRVYSPGVEAYPRITKLTKWR